MEKVSKHSEQTGVKAAHLVTSDERRATCREFAKQVPKVPKVVKLEPFVDGA